MASESKRVSRRLDMYTPTIGHIMITHLSSAGIPMQRQMRNLASQMQDELHRMYLAHEISADEFASLTEDAAIVAGRRQS